MFELRAAADPDPGPWYAIVRTVDNDLVSEP
jgi:hypothetical protein